MKRGQARAAALFAILAILASFMLAGCSEDVLIGAKSENQSPEVWLSSGPVQNETTGYQVHFYWGGWDPDGSVAYYEFVVAGHDAFGFDPQDTTGLDKWYRTSAHDSVLRVDANTDPDSTFLGSAWYTRYQKTHTFFIRAVDEEGRRSEPEWRSFTAWTLAPYITITEPRQPSSGSIATLSRVIKFRWDGRDPIDDPGNSQDPDSVRWLLVKHDPKIDLLGSATVGLNPHPELYESQWSKWVWYRAAEDSGRQTTLGDDEILELGKFYTFAVQAKDEAGAVTGIFDRRTNVRQFWVSKKAGPILTVTEPFLGGFQFLGANPRAEVRNLPPGVPLNFCWRADASSYGGVVSGYRYGWDITDVNDDEAWETEYSPDLKCAPTKTLYSGVSRFYVQVKDNSGTATLGIVEINIVEFTMDRNLLLVDDFYSTNFPVPPDYDYAMPTEAMHDTFWVDQICSKVNGFNPEEDVYDCASVNFKLPEIANLSRYKNLIWVYSNFNACWANMILFTPESKIQPGAKVAINLIALYLAKGGHIITEGRSDRVGGLMAAIFQGGVQVPMNIKCEMLGNRDGCETDTSGVNSMPYRDYCVTMLDKIVGSYRTDADMPPRGAKINNRGYDCMSNAYLASTDPRFAGFPAQLDMWSQVSVLGRYFYPNSATGPQGYTYVEVYDPAYWMTRNGITSQGCFTPLYRMRAKNILSSLHNQTIALVITRYQNVVPEIQGLAVAAPSFHFGFELWFLDHTQVGILTDEIFDLWGIRAP